MSISRKEIRHIAKLAKLRFTEAEEEVLAHDMSRILNYMGTLNQLDTSDIEPVTHVHDLTNIIRADSVQDRLNHEEALTNAPDTDGDYFRVPKVIG